MDCSPHFENRNSRSTSEAFPRFVNISLAASRPQCRDRAPFIRDSIPDERLSALSVEPARGYLSLADFTERRLHPALRTCAPFSSRLTDLAARAAQREYRRLGGLNVALEAYHIALKEKPAPILDGTTGDQRICCRGRRPTGNTSAMRRSVPPSHRIRIAPQCSGRTVSSGTSTPGTTPSA
jgi:hypothetical protein